MRDNFADAENDLLCWVWILMVSIWVWIGRISIWVWIGKISIWVWIGRVSRVWRPKYDGGNWPVLKHVICTSFCAELSGDGEPTPNQRNQPTKYVPNCQSMSS